MATTTRKNATTKAIQSIMAKAKKTNPQALIEWEMSCNTNSERGHIFDQTELHQLYSRDNWDAGHGATKTCHLRCHNGNKFEYIVVKRHQTNGYIDEHANNPDSKQTGNQLIDEINCWLEYAEREEADYLCPILKYFTSKSDKVSAISEKMQNNVVIIAQKAVEVGRCYDMCKLAEKMNKKAGYDYENADDRFYDMKEFSSNQGWRDALNNSGNSGIIFDYSKGCYKAVFIDYAL